MQLLLDKLKEILLAVLPITVIVVVLNFTLVPLGTMSFMRFLVGTLFVILGLSIFLFGVDLSVSKIANLIGRHLTHSNSVYVVLIAGLILGFFISIAEPDLHILANQVSSVTGDLISKNSILITVSIGIAFMLSLGLFRIVYAIPLKFLLWIIYGIIMILSLFTTPEFLAISFDASGATTGAMAVPFILALAVGVASQNKKTLQSEEDSFGLVGLVSTGAILGVLLLGIFSDPGELVTDTLPSAALYSTFWGPFLHHLPIIAKEIVTALLPIILIFLIGQKVAFNVSRKVLRGILLGSFYTFAGLVFFLTGVNAGFMDAGRIVGSGLQAIGSDGLTVFIAFLLGLVVILAEPAVYVLTSQIEEITAGHISRKVVLTALSIGVAFAVALSVVRILVPGLELWHFLLPGYIIAIVLSVFVPGLFVGIAFDSGGVASGPMTATFILAFAQGIANAVPEANVLIDGFGIIAMVAMAPLLALQILGLIYKIKSVKRGLDSNEQQ
ncbi:DUF1538 domain-containing protein [Proteiniclasticum sp. C24MP]|uniref:DUF1538 domain-containing protein n=1 Tax=Proteiniclasticum sp. C24MP TaxID=3374101 RepID=UPI0037553E23